MPSSSAAAPSTSSVYIDGRAPSQPKESPARAPVQHPGHHRDKLELIRDSLKPFEQGQMQEVVTVTSRGASVFSPNGPSMWPSEPLTVDKIQEKMMEDAICALKLVNFKSVTDAANLLSSAKQVTSLLGNGHQPLTATTSTNGLPNGAAELPAELQSGRLRYAPLPPRVTETPPYSSGGQFKQAGQQYYLGVTKSLPVYNSGLPAGYGQQIMEASTLSNGSSTQFESSANSSRSESPLARNSSPLAHGGAATSSVLVGGVPMRPVSPVLQRMGAERRPINAVNRVKAQYSIKSASPTEIDMSARKPTHPSGTVIRIEQQETTISERIPGTSTPLRRTDATPVARGRMPAPPPPTHIPAAYGASDAGRIQLQQQPRPLREGVQTITVDPDRYPPAGYINYVDQLRHKVENVVQLTPTPARTAPQPTTSIPSAGPYTAPGHNSTAIAVTSAASRPPSSQNPVEPQTPSNGTPEKPVRCVSPLPESVARRIRSSAYEKAVKPCRAPMFRFFMEQHTERIIQQYRERNQRAMQLAKEMEAAELADSMKEQMLRLLRQKESKYIRLKRQKMNQHMFDMIRHIGVGAFGKVTLVKKKDTGQIYAMKTLSKEDVIQKQQAAHVKAERDILAEANSVWIVRLYFSFQDAQNLYFIMEYVPGGDMMQLLINKGIFSERLARFYMAELTCALEYVHGLGFIHRDIKPDNILIDKHGHIKLTDFGLCTGLRWTHDKRHYVIYAEDDPNAAAMHYREDSFSLPPNLVNGKEHLKLLDYRHHKKRNQAHSVVGTGNYMAPEVIMKTGHTQLCDWWSVGVICYEMVYGRPPFLSPNDNPAETQYMIVNWNRYLNLDNPMGARLSRDCVNFIARMCCDQTNRLGQKGAKEVKTHSWFSRIEFERLRNMKAEYIPKVEHAEDTSNFDTFEVNSDEFFRNDAPSQQSYNPAFFDFTFRNFFASEGGHQGPSGGRTPQRPSIAPLIASSMAAAASNAQTQLSSNSNTSHSLSTTVSTTSNVSNAARSASSATTNVQYAQRSSLNGQNSQRTTNFSTYKRYDSRMTQVKEDDGGDEEQYLV